MWRKFNSMSMLKTHAPAIFSVNDTFSTVHTNKIRMRLRFDPLSRAFSNRCVFDQNPQRIGACAQNAWTHRNICLFDGALHYISYVLGQTEKIDWKNQTEKIPNFEWIKVLCGRSAKRKRQLTEILTTSWIRVGIDFLHTKYVSPRFFFSFTLDSLVKQNELTKQETKTIGTIFRPWKNALSR